jgi:DNA-binding CsgD family transcriptional regulator
MSFLAWGTGELAEAERVCHQAIELLQRAGERRSALLATNELAWIQGLRGDWVRAEETARAVAKAAETDGDHRVEMCAAAGIGYSALWRGAFAVGEEAFERSLSIAQDEGESYEHCRSLSGLAPLIALEGRTGEALSLLREARSVGPEVRDSLVVEHGTIVQWLAGDFTAAVESAREAVASNLIGKRRALGLVFGALSAAETGDIEEGRRHLAVAQAAYRGGEWALFGDYCLYAEAVLGWRETNASQALSQLHEACSRIRGWDVPPFAALPLLDLAEAAAETGDATVGWQAAGHLADIAVALDRELYRALASAAEAMAHLAGGHTDQASEAAATAVDLLSRSGCRAFEGRALDVLGRARCLGDPPGTLVAFEKAAVIFGGCGAEWRRKRSLRALERLGQRGRRLATAVAGPRPLTRREREVARLALQGLTSREIAQSLFLSERTVEAHLAHAYGKLGVRSRAELARRASELHL